MTAFVHLRLHTEYSLVDGVVRVDDLVAACAQAGMPACAVTDQSNLFAMVKFYRAAQGKGVKPIIGVDAWIREPEARGERGEPTRLTLLCMGLHGYRNLTRLVSRSYLEGQHKGVPHLDGFHGILVPGGFGERGTEGKIMAARFARERKVPYFGICLGMQMAVIEAARHVAGIADAGSQEFDHEKGANRFSHVIYHMAEWREDGKLVRRKVEDDKGGTMRLGAYAATLTPGSRVAGIYGAEGISERHRHRYEVDVKYRAALEAAGLRFSGMSPEGDLPEIVEIPDHPWFVGVQFHPELKSKPFAPHPLFASFVKAAMEQSRLM